jgi:hypothetical protein
MFKYQIFRTDVLLSEQFNISRLKNVYLLREWCLGNFISISFLQNGTFIQVWFPPSEVSCDTWGSHCGNYGDCSSLGCDSCSLLDVHGRFGWIRRLHLHGRNSTLNIGAPRSFDTSVNIYHTELCHIPEDSNVYFERYWVFGLYPSSGY